MYKNINSIDEKENIKLELARKNKQEIDNFENDVKNFIQNFNKIHNRTPLLNEINENLNDKIPKDILDKIINRLNTLKLLENV